VAWRRLPWCGSGLPGPSGTSAHSSSAGLRTGSRLLAGFAGWRAARGRRFASLSSSVPEVEQVTLQRGRKGSQEARPVRYGRVSGLQREQGFEVEDPRQRGRGGESCEKRVSASSSVLGLRLAGGGGVARAAGSGEGSSPRCQDRLRSGVGGAARKARGARLGRSPSRSGAEPTARELRTPRGAPDLWRKIVFKDQEANPMDVSGMR
jgi:hypothetical protein